MHRFRKNTANGIRVARVNTASPAYAAGLRINDVILAVNGEPVADDLDFGFFAACEDVTLDVARKRREKKIPIVRQPGTLLGIAFTPMRIRRCRNRCIFCFIDQLPRGLRKSLSVKDEDYRYSFLNGNYITLTGISRSEIDRIIQLRLSPLYISVHATDPAVRCAMLRHKKAGMILTQLRKLGQNAIAFHTQIVVCPGINDGRILQNTIRDLFSLKENLLSIAVVPVGLTKYQKNPLMPVGRAEAKQICETAGALSDRDKQRYGIRRLFVADELWLKAGLPIPGNRYYENYPQIENGVGLIRLLLKESQQCKLHLSRDAQKRLPERNARKTCLILTSVSAYPYIKKIGCALRRVYHWDEFIVEPVQNLFFGNTVTVAGLLTARDVIRTIRTKRDAVDVVFIPGVMLNYNRYTLDGYSVARISRTVNLPVVAVENLRQLITCMEKRDYGKG